MEITKNLCYGVKENTPKELLYVKRIILRSYDDETRNKEFMKLLDDFKVYQYNYDEAKDSDYFMWIYVDDNGKEHWNQVDLCCYQVSMQSVYKMWDLYNLCKTFDMNIKAEVQLDDIRNMIFKVEHELLKESD